MTNPTVYTCQLMSASTRSICKCMVGLYWICGSKCCCCMCACNGVKPSEACVQLCRGYCCKVKAMAKYVRRQVPLIQCHQQQRRRAISEVTSKIRLN